MPSPAAAGRMPVLVVPVMLLLVSFVFPTDHFFSTRPRPLTPPSTARRAEPADLVLHLDGCRLTAVAASGGGIRAAGWTAQVLTGLHREVPDFTRSLRLISAVSGGSVGAMYFVGAFNGPNGPPDTTLGNILERRRGAVLGEDGTRRGHELLIVAKRVGAFRALQLDLGVAHSA